MLDSGASIKVREVKKKENYEGLIPIEVAVAFDSGVKAELFMNPYGTTIGQEGTKNIISMYELVKAGCEVDWKKGKGGRRYMPYVFTENGVAMLSSVLNSEKAILINVSIMRIFTRLRSFLMLEKDLSDRVTKLEQGTNQMFKVVFERLDNYEEMVTPRLQGNRKKVGLK